ncbi:MAG TPA: glucan ABC transporter ATP-binding protein/ permease [Rhodanobacteraceae bacterium]|nr:glucan ABC transporter ATP-binding protein/ permease [Rhodanobacteraceae bacterium]
MSILRLYLRVLALLAPERALALALALANLGLAGVLYLEPMLFGRVVDALAHPGRHSAFLYIGAWALVGLAGAGIGVLVSLYGERMAYRRRMAAIRLYFAHALSLPLSYHASHHTGRLLRIMSIGTDNLFTLWLGFFREHLTTVLSILVLLPLAFLMSWQMALLMVALLVSFVGFNAIAIRRTRKAQGEVQESYNEIATRAGDVLGNVSVVQSFTRTRAEVKDLKKLTTRALAAQFPVLTGWATLSVFSRTASTLTIVAIFALGTALHARGAISIGGIVSFVGFALMLIGRLQQFATFISNLFIQAPAMRDYFDVLDTQPSIRERPNAPKLRKVRGEVAFEQVGFGYDAAHPTLHDLSFRVPAGTRVAVVGPTGAGKTTALSLLYRASDPDRGRITVDGQDIREVALDSLRRNISVVFQEPGLLHRSIEENLKVGNPRADAATVEAAARAAEAHAFIAEKPEAYATPVSERGRSLSGGERQRIAIARAILKDAPILILDEATSALDNTTEAHIQQALDALSQGRTTFIIAHRLSTVRNADLVLVIEHGRLVEQGRYAELIQRGGLFAALAGQGRFAPDAPPEGHVSPLVDVAA